MSLFKIVITRIKITFESLHHVWYNWEIICSNNTDWFVTDVTSGTGTSYPSVEPEFTTAYPSREPELFVRFALLNL
jgi:hypothetical protein